MPAHLIGVPYYCATSLLLSMITILNTELFCLVLPSYVKYTGTNIMLKHLETWHTVHIIMYVEWFQFYINEPIIWCFQLCESNFAALPNTSITLAVFIRMQ